jgi:hypothetical protein
MSKPLLCRIGRHKLLTKGQISGYGILGFGVLPPSNKVAADNLFPARLYCVRCHRFVDKKVKK